ncbi:MAG: mechanosensitive ion channel [Candidatus Riflebacteria bacterium]|nr:mechanosensitive ion channel [Candidatus Riflebacteria bacterium]
MKMQKILQIQKLFLLIIIFITSFQVSEVFSQSSSSEILASFTASETPELSTAVDLEAQTYELTRSAVEILLKRAQVFESSLRTGQQGIETEQIDPASEKSFLENSLNEFVVSAEMKNLANNRKLESMKLDLKILESRREIFFNRASDIETESSLLKERLDRSTDELKEAKSLEAKLVFRREILFGKQSSSASETAAVSSTEKMPVSEASGTIAISGEDKKKAVLDELIKIRREHIKTLERILVRLENRSGSLLREIEKAKTVQALFDDYLGRFRATLREFEDRVVRQNLEIQETQIKKQLDSVHNDQKALLDKIESLEKNMIEAKTATASNRLNLLVLQREQYNIEKDRNAEKIRYLELSLRSLKESVQINDVKNRLQVDGRVVSDDQKNLDYLKVASADFTRDLLLMKKKNELLSANRLLLEQALKEFDKGKAESRLSSAKSEDIKEEKRLRERKLECLDENISLVASQSAIIADLLEKITDTGDIYEKAIQKEKERQLFARRVLRIEKDFFENLIQDVLNLPKKFIDDLTASLKTFDLTKLLILVFSTLLVVVLSIILWKSNYFRPVLAGPLAEIFSWLHGEMVFLILLSIQIIITTVFPHLYRYFFPFIVIMASRLVYSICRLIIVNIGIPSDFSTFLVNLLKTVAIFLPVSAFLRQIAFYSAVLYFWELLFKIFIFFSIVYLVRRRNPIRAELELSFKEKLKKFEWKILSGSFSLFVFLMPVSVIISFPGYNNLAVTILKYGGGVLFLLIVFVTSRILSEKTARLIFNSENPQFGLIILSNQKTVMMNYITTRIITGTLWLIVLSGLIYLSGVSITASVMGPVFEWLKSNGQYLTNKLMKIFIIVAGSLIILEFTKTIGESIVSYVSNQHLGTQSENERRVSTLVQIFHTSMKVVLFCIAGIMILREMDMDITPLLTGAGIIGIAVGFGSQSLVKDFFSGFFILIENQFRVGDVVEIAGKSGLVEKINLKTTVLRAVDGSVFIIPNGEITSVKNMTYIWSRAIIDVGVGYGSNIDKVFALLTEIGEELRAGNDFSRLILEKPEILGVENLGESSVDIRVLIKVRPFSQWNIARAFRKRILEVFAKEGIDIPFPQRVVTLETGDSLKAFLAMFPDANKHPGNS